MLLFPGVYRRWLHPSQPVQIRLEPYVPKTEKSWANKFRREEGTTMPHTNGKEYTRYESTKRKPDFFYFDPNQINEADWMRLGVKPQTAQTILKYRSKGGRFRKPEDLKNIWGLSPLLAEQLIPYVRIATEPAFGSKAPERIYPDRVIPTSPVMLDINQSDSAAWEALPGIGPALARRIIRFRNMLGGFYCVDQVAETFGLPDSTFQRIRNRLQCRTPELNKIPVNDASLDQLKQHPYIRFAYARKWDAYRNQHGRFRSREELQQALLMPDSVFAKLEHYLAGP